MQKKSSTFLHFSSLTILEKLQSKKQQIQIPKQTPRNNTNLELFLKPARPTPGGCLRGVEPSYFLISLTDNWKKESSTLWALLAQPTLGIQNLKVGLRRFAVCPRERTH